jgi:hypothetical protein
MIMRILFMWKEVKIIPKKSQNRFGLDCGEKNGSNTNGVIEQVIKNEMVNTDVTR